MKIYLAARYARFPEMQQVASILHEDGHHVTSRWIWGEHQAHDTHLLDPDRRGMAAGFAREDMQDLYEATCFVGFSDTPGTYARGGRHVELGIALACGKRICIIGGAEHVFHALHRIEHYPDLAALRLALGKGIRTLIITPALGTYL